MHQKLHQAKQYIAYRKQANSRLGHGIHSPFVFNLIEEVFNKRGEFYAYKDIEELREKLLKVKDKIRITDFGAGSLVNNTNLRSICSVTKNVILPKQQAQLLFRLVNHFQPKTILELGTSLGLTTAYLASAKKQAKVYTMEACPVTQHIAEQHFEVLGIQNIISILGNFNEQLPTLLKTIDTVNFAFIDGNHSFEPIMRYFHWLLPKINENSILVFDDIYWSESMTKAWNEIKSNPKVTLTIDLYRMGLVFFRKESSKENFKVCFP